MDDAPRSDEPPASPDREPATDRHSAALNRAILDTTVDGIITITPQGVIQSANRAAARMFGYEQRELVGQPVAMLMPEPHRSSHQRYIDDYQRTGKAKIIGIGRELEARRKDGSQFPIDLAVSETRLGTRVIFTGIVRDLSERERVRRALAEEQRFAAAVLQTVGALVVVLDTDGRIQRFNRACELATGYTEQEVIGWPVTELIPEDERPGVGAVFTQLRDGHRANVYENHWQARSGERRLIAWTNSVLLAGDGEVRNVIGTGLDITRVREAERATVEVSERERQRIGQDLHDVLGQQLTGLSLLAKSLERELADRGAAEAEQAQRLGATAQQAVGEMRRIARGLFPSELEQHGLAAALYELAASVTGEAQCTATGSGPATLNRGVALQLYRIAQEAVANALRHAGATSIRVELQHTDRALSLSIADNGTGMDTNAGTSAAAGTGLLSMEHRARSIGGELGIDSSGGYGTTVTCTVPAASWQ